MGKPAKHTVRAMVTIKKTAYIPRLGCGRRNPTAFPAAFETTFRRRQAAWLSFLCRRGAAHTRLQKTARRGRISEQFKMERCRKGGPGQKQQLCFFVFADALRMSSGQPLEET